MYPMRDPEPNLPPSSRDSGRRTARGTGRASSRRRTRRLGVRPRGSARQRNRRWRPSAARAPRRWTCATPHEERAHTPAAGRCRAPVPPAQRALPRIHDSKRPATPSRPGFRRAVPAPRRVSRAPLRRYGPLRVRSNCYEWSRSGSNEFLSRIAHTPQRDSGRSDPFGDSVAQMQANRLLLRVHRRSARKRRVRCARQSAIVPTPFVRTRSYTTEGGAGLRSTQVLVPRATQPVAR